MNEKDTLIESGEVIEKLNASRRKCRASRANYCVTLN